MKALIKKSTGKPEALWAGYEINQDFIDAVEKDYAGECKRAYFTGMWAQRADGSDDESLGTTNHPTAKDILNAFNKNASYVEICDMLDDNTPVEYMLVEIPEPSLPLPCKFADLAEGVELIEGSISKADFSRKTVRIELVLDNGREAHYNVWSEWLFPLMEAVGADQWSDLGRVRIRAVAVNGFVYGIGHATEDSFFVSNSIMNNVMKKA